VDGLTIATILSVTLIVGYAIFAAKRPAAAIATSTLAALALLVAWGLADTPAGLLLIPVLFLFTFTGVMMSRTGPEEPTWPKTLAKTVLIILAVLICLALAGGFGGPFIVIAALLIWMIIDLMVTCRQNVAVTVFSTLGAAMHQNLPLPEALQFASLAQTGERANVLWRISRRLTEGNALAEAIRLGYPRCPGNYLALVSAAEDLQQLPPAFADIQTDLEEKARNSRRISPVNPAYVLIVALACMFAIWSIRVLVLPSFHWIFADMGATMPGLTRMIMLDRLEVGALLTIVTIAMLAGFALWVYTLFRSRRADRPYLLSRAGDLVKWHLPLVGKLERNRSMMRVAGFLRHALPAGSTIDQAVDRATELDLNGRYRKRVRKWADMIRSGASPSDAARSCKVGRPLAWALDGDVNPNNAPAVLEAIESFYRTQYAYAINLVASVFWPLVTLGLAGMVGCVVFATFLPYITLIRAVVAGTMP